MRISDWSSDVCSSDLSAARSLEGVRYMNKKIPLLTLGAALIAVPVLAAPGGGDRNATQTRAEVQSKAAEMFARLDANKDGKDRQSVVKGKSVAVRVDDGGRRINKKKKTIDPNERTRK